MKLFKNIPALVVVTLTFASFSAFAQTANLEADARNVIAGMNLKYPATESFYRYIASNCGGPTLETFPEEAHGQWDFYAGGNIVSRGFLAIKMPDKFFFSSKRFSGAKDFKTQTYNRIGSCLVTGVNHSAEPRSLYYLFHWGEIGFFKKEKAIIGRGARSDTEANYSTYWLK